MGNYKHFANIKLYLFIVSNIENYKYPCRIGDQGICEKDGTNDKARRPYNRLRGQREG